MKKPPLRSCWDWSAGGVPIDRRPPARVSRARLEEVGILRLRKCCTSFRTCCAQDDRGYWVRGRMTFESRLPNFLRHLSSE